MANIPDPATTEWVPLWDLNGTKGPKGDTGPEGPPSTVPGPPGATGGIHHTQHELGGTDVIQNNAWLSTPNIFTANQSITKGFPRFQLSDTDQPADAKLFEFAVTGQILYIQAINDAQTAALGTVQINRSGGMGLSSNLSVSNNIPRIQIIDISQPADGKIFEIASANGTLYLQALNDAQSVQQGSITMDRVGNLTLPAGYLTINKNQPEIRLIDSSQPANAKIFRTVNISQLLFIQAVDDTIANQGYIVLNRAGVLGVPYGFTGDTPFNASQLTSGTVPDARLGVSGLWTPIVTGTGGLTNAQTYNYQQGSYHKIGKLVTIWSYTQFKGPADGGPANAHGFPLGDAILTNLPFPMTSSLSNPPFMAGSVAYYSNLGTPQDITGLTCYAPFGQNYVLIKKLRSNASNPIPLAGTDINPSTQLIMTITYLTD